MAEWLRPGLWEVLTIRLRGIEPSQGLIHKTHRGGLVLKLRPLVTVAGVSQVSRGVRMAEWLRPRLWEVLTIRLRGFEPGQILIYIKAHRGGLVLKLRPLVTVAGVSQFFKGSGWPSG